MNKDFEAWVKQCSEKFKRRQDQYFKHLNKKDLDLIILKGHLIVEQRINEAFEKKLKPNLLKRVKDLRFSIPTKLVFLQAMGNFDKTFDHFFEAVEKLNNLRNKMAHNLECPKIEDQAKEILSLMYKGECLNKRFQKYSLIYQLKRAIILIAEMASLPSLTFPNCGIQLNDKIPK
ncbi:MAG: hypothetical protein HYU97_07210 [Deltaproteobacteria bacterium]|nr:hypothetical protein [Deltaproteobacteria bacterium]